MRVNTIDLNNDWLRLVKTELESEGFDLTDLTDNKISILYYSLEKRLISKTPRQIFKSTDFSCPENLYDGLKQLEEKIKNGDDLRPHLSRKLKHLDDKDGLLFDWGIYHLHLGTVIESDGFINRTGPLLHARFDNDSAYFINIFNHGAWTKQAMLKTIHDNWPDSIKRFRLQGVLGVEKKFEDSDIHHLRNARVNTLIEIEPGVVYMGPGWGFAASGDSIDAVEKHTDRLWGLSELEKNIKGNTNGLLSSLFQDLSFITNQNLDFELVRENGKFHVYEKNNDFHILLQN
jgi:hypothetical protein